MSDTVLDGGPVLGHLYLTSTLGEGYEQFRFTAEETEAVRKVPWFVHSHTHTPNCSWKLDPQKRIP